MQVVVIGSGPVGMTAALLLARDGHRITLVDRDPGPAPGVPWSRVGVMQFHLPHGFRPQCRTLLHQRLPDVHEAVLDAGAVVAQPTGRPEAAWLQTRRSVVEQTMWEATSREPGVERLTGHVDRVVVEGGVATGVSVGSRLVPADLVVDASGRAGRIVGAGPAPRRVDCGMAYASRQYRLRPGATPGPLNGGPGWMALHRGFLAVVFPHEAGVFTILIVRPSADRELAGLRHPAVFEAACRIIPGLAEWSDPARSQPVDVVRAGAGLVNAYAPQAGSPVRLVRIGDAFCTTNPQGGRGVTLGLQSAATLVDLVRELPVTSIAAALDRWGETALRPWYDDHLQWDAALLAQWAGRPLDPDKAIGPETLVAAAQRFHPEWMVTLGQYFEMARPPAALEPLRTEVRRLVRDGWQPDPPPGPDRAELAALIGAEARAEPIPDLLTVPA